jgi:hypothetical protein
MALTSDRIDQRREVSPQHADESCLGTFPSSLIELVSTSVYRKDRAK